MADLAPEVSPEAWHHGGRGSRGRLWVDTSNTSNSESLAGEWRQDGLTALPGDVQVLAEVVTHVLLHNGGGDTSLPMLGSPVFLQVASGGENFTTVRAGDILFVWPVLTNSLKEK